MANKLVDIYKRILKYNEHSVYIAFGNDGKPYFHINQLCEMMGYKDIKDAVKTHIPKEDIFYLKNIIVNYKKLYKNIQGNTKFTNQAGLFTIITKSKLKDAEEIRYWINHNVLPALWEHGQYKLSKSSIIEIEKLKKEIIEKSDKIEVLKYNLKQPKFKKGNVIYIIREIIDRIDFGNNEILKLKIGKSGDLKKRKSTYDTSFPYRSQIVKSLVVQDKEAIESCLKNKLTKYLIITDKEYYECTYNDLIEQLATCVKFYEKIEIDKTPDKNTELSRENIGGKFDTTKKVHVYFENDDDNNSDSDIGDSVINDTTSDKNYDDNQAGGSYDFDTIRMKYLKYQLKYLILLNEL